MPPDPPKRNPRLLSTEQLHAAIDRGEIDTVIVAFADMQGRLQGKRLHARYLFDEVLGTAGHGGTGHSGTGRGDMGRGGTGRGGTGRDDTGRDDTGRGRREGDRRHSSDQSHEHGHGHGTSTRRSSRRAIICSPSTSR